MMKLRLATLEDTHAIEALIELSARGLSTEDYSAEQIEGALKQAWGLDTQLIEDGTYLVVEEGGDLVACGGWSFRKTLFGNDAEKDRDASIIDPKTGAAKIRAFFVHPDFSRQGLGTLILSQCEEAAIQQGYTQLELMATLPGLRLYEYHGFVGEHSIEYPLDDELTITFVPMTKTL